MENKINMINGNLIGTKTIDNTPILLDHLLNNDYINIYSGTYGIYIPSYELINRNNYSWFVRMSPVQILESNIIIAKYMLLSNTPNAKSGVIEAMRDKKNWVSFWRVPSGAPVWGLKPIDLGNFVPMESHPSQ